jgi:serine protease Do
MPVGKDVPVKILRDGKEQNLTVQISERKDPEEQAARGGQTPEGDELGIRAADLNPESARRFGLDESERGVVIAAVRPGSKADQGGLQQGDVVKEVNRTPVQTVKELKAEYSKAKPGEAVAFLVKRANAGFVVVKVMK